MNNEEISYEQLMPVYQQEIRRLTDLVLISRAREAEMLKKMKNWEEQVRNMSVELEAYKTNQGENA
ncbi:hypothetical protein [Enterococcus casseliflavus]|uniref:hypothetical protein n=1 Tax=Enterococcus casseliflavus TaxID=37734 RepID=UPI00301B25AF